MLAVTPGEPAGIGAECLLKLAANGDALPVIAVADPGFLQDTSDSLGLGDPTLRRLLRRVETTELQAHLE